MTWRCCAPVVAGQTGHRRLRHSARPQELRQPIREGGQVLLLPSRILLRMSLGTLRCSDQHRPHEFPETTCPWMRQAGFGTLEGTGSWGELPLSATGRACRARTASLPRAARIVVPSVPHTRCSAAATDSMCSSCKTAAASPAVCCRRADNSRIWMGRPVKREKSAAVPFSQ